MSNGQNPFRLNELALSGDIEVQFPQPSRDIKSLIAEKCGDVSEGELTQITDLDYKGLDTSDGTTFYRLYNLETEREDLRCAQDVGERILSKYERENVIKSAFIETLRFISKYIPMERILATCPNLDLEKIDEYDFKKALLYIFILSDEAFNLIKISDETPHSDLLNKSGYHIGTHKPDKEPKEGPLGPTKYINTSGKNLIVIKERGTVTNQLSTNYGRSMWPEEYKAQIVEQVRSVLIHELLHDLQIGIQFNDELEEALVEFTSILINLQSRPGKSSQTAYSTGVAFIEKMLLMGEFSPDELLRVYVSLNEESKTIGKRIAQTLERKYGLDATKRILNFTFTNMNDAFDYISRLESQDQIPQEDYSI